jgi:hypothetical protein
MRRHFPAHIVRRNSGSLGASGAGNGSSVASGALRSPAAKLVALQVKPKGAGPFRTCYTVRHPRYGEVHLFAESMAIAKLLMVQRWGFDWFDDWECFPTPNPHRGPVKVYR